MIITMKAGCNDNEINDVLTFLDGRGLRGYPLNHVESTIISVLQAITPSSTSCDQDASCTLSSTVLEVFPGVAETHQVSKAYQLASREFHPANTVITVSVPCVSGGIVTIGSQEIVPMAGPCTVENEKQLMHTARAVREAGAVILRGGAFKPSTSPYGFRGLGEAGLKLLGKARSELGMAIITEVMTPADVPLVCEYADILQIGTRNMQNYLLLEEVGRTQKPIVLKRGMAASIEEWLLAAEYILLQGNPNVMLCERGIRTFEKMTRNTMDISAIPLIKQLSHLPVISDPSQGTGLRDLVPSMTLASVVAGADGLLIEVHYNPEIALKDGPQSLTIEQFRHLMPQVERAALVVGRTVVTG